MLRPFLAVGLFITAITCGMLGINGVGIFAGVVCIIFCLYELFAGPDALTS